MINIITLDASRRPRSLARPKALITTTGRQFPSQLASPQQPSRRNSLPFWTAWLPVPPSQPDLSIVDWTLPVLPLFSTSSNSTDRPTVGPSTAKAVPSS